MNSKFKRILAGVLVCSMVFAQPIFSEQVAGNDDFEGIDLSSMMARNMPAEENVEVIAGPEPYMTFAEMAEAVGPEPYAAYEPEDSVSTVAYSAIDDGQAEASQSEASQGESSQSESSQSESSEGESSQGEASKPGDDGSSEVVCECKELCTSENPNMECPVFSLVEDGDYSCCSGVTEPKGEEADDKDDEAQDDDEEYEAPCICEELCLFVMFNPDCPVCSLVEDDDFSCCGGEEQVAVVFDTARKLDVKTYYKGVAYLDNETITVTDDSFIRLQTTLSLSNNENGGTLTFVIPEGYELANAPGINGLNSDGSIISKDLLQTEKTYLIDPAEDSSAITWTRNTDPTSGVTAKSGELTYKLTDPITGFGDISVYIKADGNYTDYTTPETAVLATSPTVTYSATDQDDLVEECADIEINAGEYRLTIGTMTISENISPFIVDAVDKDASTLVSGLSDTVNIGLNLGVAISGDAIGTAIWRGVANGVTVTVKVPENAVVTSGYTVTENTDKTEAGYVYYDISGITSTTKTIPATLTISSLMSVTFPVEFFGIDSDTTITKKYPVSITGFSFEERAYDADTSDFTTKPVANDTFALTTNIGITNKTATMGQYSNFFTRNTYDDDGETVGDLNHQEDTVVRNPGDGSTQTLYWATRASAYDTTTKEYTNNLKAFSDFYSFIYYTQDKVNGVYQDNVTKVELATPLLGNVDMYSAKLVSMKIIVEDVAGNTGEYTVVSNLSDSWAPNIVDNVSISSNISLNSDASGKVSASYTAASYEASTPSYPKITVTASTGYSIIYAEAFFDGDNNTYTDGISRVYGYPKSDVPTTNFSVHKFRTLHADTDGDYLNIAPEELVEKKFHSSFPKGFKWDDPIPFEMTSASTNMSNVVPTLYYTFNTAEDNLKYQISWWQNNPRGYLDMAIFAFRNYSGSVGENVVFEILANENIKDEPSAVKDVIKIITFPYDTSLGYNQIASIEYRYEGDSVSNFYEYSFHGDDVPYNLETWSVKGETTTYYKDKIAVLTAPDGKSFDYVKVTYDTWTSNIEMRYVMLKGYVEGHDLNTNRSTKDIHQLNLYYAGDDPIDGNKVDLVTGTPLQNTHNNGKTWYDIPSEVGDFEILNTIVDGEYNQTVLAAGRTTTVQVNVFAGHSVYSVPGYRGIAFDIVLPSGLRLDNVHADNVQAINSSDPIGDKFNSNDIGGISIVSQTPLSDGSTRYRVELDNEFFRLYSFYSSVTKATTQLGFTLSMDIYASAGSIGTYNYSDIFFMGSTVHKLTTSSNNVYKGNAAIATKTALTHDFSYTALTATSDMQLKVDSFPFVSVHSNRIEVDGVDRYYNVNDTESSVWLNEPGEDATIKFSITNMVGDDTDSGFGKDDRIAYVYYPLPINENVSSLMYTTDIESGSLFTLNTDDGNEPISISSDGNATIEWTYRNLPAQTNIFNLDEVAKDFEEGKSSDNSGNANSLIIKITGMEVEETVSVEIDIKAPDSVEDIDEVDLSGVVIFNYDKLNNTNIFFGGREPEIEGWTVASEYVGGNPLRFNYYHPMWEMNFQAILHYTLNGADMLIPFHNLGWSAMEFSHNETVEQEKFPDLDTMAITGYTYDNGNLWFEDSTLTIPYDDNVGRIEDTTVYARLTAKSYTVNYYYGANNENKASAEVSWERTDLGNTISLYGHNPHVNGYTLDSWNYGSKGADKLIDATDGYNDIVGDDDTITSIDLYANYSEVEYTVNYKNVTELESSPKMVKWTDKGILPTGDYDTDGRVLSMWRVQGADGFLYEVTNDMTMEYIVLNVIGASNDEKYHEITLYAYFIYATYTVEYDNDGYVFDGSNNLGSRTVYWTTEDITPRISFTPTIDGLDFLGWSVVSKSEGDPQTLVDISDTYGVYNSYAYNLGDGAFSLKLYPVFTPSKYTVTYDFNQSTYAHAPAPVSNSGKMEWDDAFYQSDLFAEYTFPGDSSSSIFPVTAVDEFKEMYIFEGWYTTPNFESGSKITNIETAKLQDLMDDSKADTLTIYARYNLVHYAVEYFVKAADSAVLSDADIDYLTANASLYERGRLMANAYILPTTVTAKGNNYNNATGEFSLYGYEWKGWLIDGYSDSVEVDDLIYYEVFGYDENNYEDAVNNDILGEKIDVYGQFALKNIVVIYDDSNFTGNMVDGFTLANSSVTWNQTGMYIDIENDTIEGKTFDGWYTEPTFVNEVTEDTMISSFSDSLQSSIDGSESIMLYAKFIDTEYLINYDIGYAGGELIAPAVVTLDSQILLPAVSERDGYTFAGWYTTAFHDVAISGDITYKELADEQGVTSYSQGVTVYAKWVFDFDLTVTSVVKFEAEDGSDTSGTLLGGYNVSNNSVANIMVEQRVSNTNSQWGFVNKSFDDESAVMSMAEVIQIAEMNNINYDEAVSLITSYGFTVEGSSVARTVENEEVVNKDSMYATITDGTNTAVLYEDFYDEILVYAKDELELDIILEYKLYQAYDQQYTIDLFDIEYVFTLMQ